MRRLREEYSWLWLLTGAAMLVAVIWHDSLVFISKMIGAVSTVSTVFFLGMLFLMLLCLQFSVRLSRMTEQIKTLGQKIALLEAEKAERERCPPQKPSDGIK
jgi:hypothetical protein